MKAYIGSIIGILFMNFGLHPVQHIGSIVNKMQACVVKPMDDEPRPVHGKGKKPDTTPVTGAVITLSTYPGGVFVAADTTDSNGDFDFSSVYPGNYRLVGTASGCQTAIVDFTVIAGSGAQQQDVVFLEE